MQVRILTMDMSTSRYWLTKQAAYICFEHNEGDGQLQIKINDIKEHCGVSTAID